MATEAHRDAAAAECVVAAVLTISDTRREDDDRSGQVICSMLEAAGHRVADKRIVRDEADLIDQAMTAWRDDPSVHVVLSTGGTGIAQRDTTIEVVERLIERPLPGFGELFRMLSWEQVGSAAMLSRAAAGLAGDTFLFAMPGSTRACELAMEKLILPELRHLVWENRR